jgi:thiamine biosynthesis lipoprotein ApbE
MKNLTIIIFILSILFTQSSFAEITGKINERVDNKWNLYLNKKYIDITNKGFSVSESKSTILPNNKSHLFNANIFSSAIDIPDKTTVIAQNATLADGLSTTYAVSDKDTRKTLLSKFPDVQFITS